MRHIQLGLLRFGDVVKGFWDAGSWVAKLVCCFLNSLYSMGISPSHPLPSSHPLHLPVPPSLSPFLLSFPFLEM